MILNDRKLECEVIFIKHIAGVFSKMLEHKLQIEIEWYLIVSSYHITCVFRVNPRSLFA